MSSLAKFAASYLTPMTGTFWKWSESGTVIEWSDGQSLTFRDELLSVLEYCQATGLPEFDLVLLTLAACRDNWNQEPQRSDFLQMTLAFNAGSTKRDAIRNALELLNEIAALPASLRSSVAVKGELISLLVNRQNPVAEVAQTREVLEELRRGTVADEAFAAQREAKPQSHWISELRRLNDRFSVVTSEYLEARIRTGLSVLPNPDATAPRVVTTGREQQEPETLEEFLKLLEKDAAFQGLSRLTRNLLAIVQLPRPIDELEDLPAGGVSDIANRGPLHRLLLSELANDDDVLMTRVAMQEALYYRREKPPANPPHTRAILLDSGLRMWGLPRLFAAGVALSLTGMKNLQTRIFRAAGRELEEVDLRTKEGLIQHLAALEPALHPGDSLAAFQRVLAGKQEDVVLITGADVWTDADFQRQLQLLEIPCLYVAVVNRSGELKLLTRSARGEKLLREAQLDLDSILQAEPARRTDKSGQLLQQNWPVDQTVSESLPAMLRLRQYPIRLSCSIHPERILYLKSHQHSEPCAFSFTNDGRLLLWDRQGFAGRVLSDRIPRGAILAFQEQGELVRVVIGNLATGEFSLITLDVNTWLCSVDRLDISKGQTLAVHFQNDFVLVMRNNTVAVCYGTDGHLLDTLKVQARDWVSHRFYQGKDGLLAAAYDGFRLRLEPVLNGLKIHAHGGVASAFDSAVMEGPVVVFKNGTLQAPPGVPKRIVNSLEGRVYVTAVSHSGSRFGMTIRSGEFRHVDVKSGQILNHSFRKYDLKELRDEIHFPNNIRVRFSRIGIAGGSYLLLTRRQKWMTLEYDSLFNRIRLSDTKDVVSSTTQAFSQLVHSPSGRRYQLTQANFPNGSVAVLDSRGLLHLRSHDPSLPETTLILDENFISGWTSHGECFGDSRYHLHPDKVESSLTVWERDIKPFFEQLR